MAKSRSTYDIIRKGLKFTGGKDGKRERERADWVFGLGEVLLGLYN